MTTTLKPIRNEDEYDQALARIDEIWEAADGSAEADELEVLTILVAAYEKDVHPIPLPDPIDAIRFAMDQRELKPRDLESVIGSSGRVSEVLRKQRPLTLKMIRKLHAELGVAPGVLISEYRVLKGKQRRRSPSSTSPGPLAVRSKVVKGKPRRAREPEPRARGDRKRAPVPGGIRSTRPAPR
jgi:HTH-type transcriptional regulator / antitoxin HigA